MIDDIDRRFRKAEPPKPVELEPQRSGDPCPAPTCKGHFKIGYVSNGGGLLRVLHCGACLMPAKNPVMS